jgi:hypothetical protein
MRVVPFVFAIRSSELVECSIGYFPVFVAPHLHRDSVRFAMKTRNEALQTALESWAQAAEAAYKLPNPSAQRTDAILDFCRTFVPFDVTEDDIDHFSGNLSTDDVSGNQERRLTSCQFLYVCTAITQEFFEAFVRELKQCASGDRVESIEGDQKKKALYTLLAPEGTGTPCL